MGSEFKIAETGATKQPQIRAERQSQILMEAFVVKRSRRIRVEVLLTGRLRRVEIELQLKRVYDQSTRHDGPRAGKPRHFGSSAAGQTRNQSFYR